MNSSQFQAYEASNLDNIEFYYANGTIIPSWLESNATSTATSTSYWLDLAYGIAADYYITVWMGFASPSVNLLNDRTVGESPSLSAVYGEYDNGARVFDDYANFSGTTLPAGWIWDLVSGSATATVNNGLTATTSGAGNTIGSVVSDVSTSSGVIEGYVSAFSNGVNSNIWALVASTSSTSYSYSADSVGWQNGLQLRVQNNPSGTASIVATSTINPGPGFILGTYGDKLFVNYRTGATISGNILGAGYVAIQVGSGTTVPSVTYQWIRARAEPPNGVMPTVSVGSLSGVPTISSFSASPSPSTVGKTTFFNVTASGGTGFLRYSYSGLPEGCSSANTSSLSCIPATSGTFAVRVYVNDSVGHSANAIASLTVSPKITVSSVALTPKFGQVQTGKIINFSATATCSTGSCPPGVTYSWALNNTLGSTSPITDNTTTFTAGANAGVVTLTVNASLNGVSKEASAVINITTTALPVLTGVSLNATSVSIPTGGTQGIAATPVCSPGSCPSSGITYLWTLNNTLGSLNSSSGQSSKFTAGRSLGTVALTVKATLNGTSASTTATITITGLTSVAVSPNASDISTNSYALFTATPVCSTACPSGTYYSWTITDSSIGALNTSSGSSVKFTSGTIPGVTGLIVNATLDGVTKQSAAALITVSGSPPTLESVEVGPASASVEISGRQLFDAIPYCSESCSTGISYSWTLTRTFGILGASVGQTVNYTAGTNTGTVGLFLNATYNSKTVASPPVIITVTPALTGVAISPSTGVVQVSKTFTFSAADSCSSTPCPSGIFYSWRLNNTLGSLSTSTSSTTTFTAGSMPGLAELSLTATLDGTNRSATGTVSISAAPVPELAGVTATVESLTVGPGGTDNMVATSICSPGPCPSSGIAYFWSMNIGLGSLNSSQGNMVTFTAGNMTGNVSITVQATYNGESVTSNVQIAITEETNIGNSTPNAIIFVIVLAAVAAVVAMAFALRRRTLVNMSEEPRASVPVSGPASPQPERAPTASPEPPLEAEPKVPDMPPASPGQSQSTKKVVESPCPECHTLVEEGTQVCEVCGHQLADMWKDQQK